MRYTVEVTQLVEVDIDTDEMNEEWMREYREVMFDHTTHEDHAHHIAQMRAREVFNEFSDGVEGYGDNAEMARVVPKVRLVPFHCETTTVDAVEVSDG